MASAVEGVAAAVAAEAVAVANSMACSAAAIASMTECVRVNKYSRALDCRQHRVVSAQAVRHVICLAYAQQDTCQSHQHISANQGPAPHRIAGEQQNMAHQCTVEQAAAQLSTAQQSTTQRSTAQSSTAQHSTARHSTAWHGTAWHTPAHGSTPQRTAAQPSIVRQTRQTAAVRQPNMPHKVVRTQKQNAKCTTHMKGMCLC